MALKSFLLCLVSLLFLPLAQFATGAEIPKGPRVIIGDTPGETVVVNAGTIRHYTGIVLIMGDGVLIVRGQLHLTGPIYVTGSGTFLVDGGEFHLKGNDTNIYVCGKGRVISRANATLHYVQSYVAQHNIICWDNGSVVLENTLVDCDGSIEFIWMMENSCYTARSVTYKHWKTWYLHDNTSLTLENVNIAGDIVFYDSPTMSFTNTNVIMPWLHFDSGAVVDCSLPLPSTNPTTLTIDNSTPGISGIPWSLSLKDCRRIAWGVNPYPGSDVTVRNSYLTMVMWRFLGNGSFGLNGIMRNNSFYLNKTIPVPDRKFRLVNTFVNWWKVDVHDDFMLRADSIVISEMVNGGNSRAHITNSICEGQTIHLGVKDNAFLIFEDGEVWSYVSAWKDSTLILVDSLVDWTLGQYIYQISNIAHDSSRLYCLNSMLREPPEAHDEALAMFASIDLASPVPAGSAVPVPGSAWIDAGPKSPVTFKGYELAWALAGTAYWTTIRVSASPVNNGTLGVWDTSGLAPGDYRLRLKVGTDGDTSANQTQDYPAYVEIELR